MSFVAMAADAVKAIRPRKDEPVESLAARMFDAQSSFYDSCSAGVGGSFFELPEMAKKQWIQSAERKLRGD